MIAIAVALCGCGARHGDAPPPDSDHPDTTVATGDSAVCDNSALGSPDASYVLAPEFANFYATYKLGAPGVEVRALAIAANDPDHLLVTSGAGIYSVAVRREPCGHIVGFAGSPTLVAANPQAASFGALAIGPNHLAFTMFSTSSIAIGLAELPPGQASAVYTVDLDAFGVGTGRPDDGTGAQASVAFVPTTGSTPALAISDALGHWYQLTYAAEQSWFAVSAAATTVTLLNAGYGIGYVPMGSPGFAQSSVLVGGSGIVTAYAVDGSGTPIASTAAPFYAQFGNDAMRAEAFDPETGDLLFVTVMTGAISIVQGFAPIL